MLQDSSDESAADVVAVAAIADVVAADVVAVVAAADVDDDGVAGVAAVVVDDVIVVAAVVDDVAAAAKTILEVGKSLQRTKRGFDFESISILTESLTTTKGRKRK